MALTGGLCFLALTSNGFPSSYAKLIAVSNPTEYGFVALSLIAKLRFLLSHQGQDFAFSQDYPHKEVNRAHLILCCWQRKSNLAECFKKLYKFYF